METLTKVRAVGAAGVRDPLSLVTSALAVVVELEQNLLVWVEAGKPGVGDGPPSMETSGRGRKGEQSGRESWLSLMQRR